jgi:hypothetical protein
MQDEGACQQFGTAELPAKNEIDKITVLQLTLQLESKQLGQPPIRSGTEGLGQTNRPPN